MRAQQHSPTKLKWLLNSLIALGLVSLPITWYFAPTLGTFATLGSSLLGGLTSLTALAGRFISDNIFGKPASKIADTYQDNEDAEYQGATATFVRQEGHCPKLVIQAGKPHQAGYVEGYALAPQIQSSLEQINFLYQFIRPLIGAPKKDSDMAAFLRDIEKHIPPRFVEEMKGKVQGYDQWLADNHLDGPTLSYEKYLLLHLLPDAHHYLPFKNPKMVALPNMGCTSTAIRTGKHVLYSRVLDWPAYNVAGSQFLQIERHVGDFQATTDIGLPLMTGALTSINESGLFVQMNVSRSNKVITPKGMPALFYNRYIAEMAKSVVDAEKLVNATDKPQPLSAYHLQVSDGSQMKAIHLQLSREQQGEHHIEALARDKESPSILTVANNGVRWQSGDDSLVLKPISHHDSDARRANIHAFFARTEVQEKLQAIRNTEVLSLDDKADLMAMMHQLCQLDLVNNCESVLCLLLLYSEGQLVEARMASDNLYAPDKAMGEFMSCYQ